MRAKFNFNYLTLFSALFISSVAIWYSISGLAAIFAASKIPVIIMGTALEIGKLITAVWLHRNWDYAKLWIKTYLSIALVILMFITSMGIFGFLSKSHVEQTSASEESVAQIKRIDDEIGRNKAIIERSQEKIKNYEDNGSGVDAGLNAQIDKEQERIDSAYDRVKPVIQVQLDIIKAEEAKNLEHIKPYQIEIDQINADLVALETALQHGEIKKAQRIVGSNDDGSYGSKTIAALQAYRLKKEERRKSLLKKIDEIKSTISQSSINAQNEIKRIRATVQAEIDESNATIKKLRARLGKTNSNDIETLIVEEQNKIKEANTELDALVQNKYKIEAGYRKLQVEVGPIKYIAEMVYGDNPDAGILEKAVRWVIILIIFVFDPLAVGLLISVQYSFEREETHEKPLVQKHDELENTVLSEPAMPNNIDVPEFAVTSLTSEIITPDELDEIFEEPKPQLGNISLVRVGDNYINYNGKVYSIQALYQTYPDLLLDFNKEVRSGSEFPEATRGTMFINIDMEPTQLFIFNGVSWDKIDKNILNFNAYSREYIKALIKRIGNSNYNPELLNDNEKQHIENLLG